MRKKKLLEMVIMTIIGFSLFNGCSNKSNTLVNSNGSTNRLEAVATGTAVGAGIGAVVGKRFNDTKFGAFVGGMLGAVAGDVVHKTSQQAARNEHIYAETEKRNNQTRDKLNKASNEMENTMGSSNR